MRVPKLLRSLVITRLGNVFPIVCLTLESVCLTPVGVNTFVCIVRVHLQQISRMACGICTDQQVADVTGLAELHAVVRQFVQPVVAGGEPHAECNKG